MMLKSVAFYKELGWKESQKSMLDHCSQTPMSGKALVLQYLRSGDDDGVRCSSIHDRIIGDTTFLDCSCYTDGEYTWDDEDIYHFEKYNIELEPEFLKKVLAS